MVSGIKIRFRNPLRAQARLLKLRILLFFHSLNLQIILIVIYFYSFYLSISSVNDRLRALLCHCLNSLH